MKSVPVVLAMLAVLYSLLMLLLVYWCWSLCLSGEARCLTVRLRDYKVALRKVFKENGNL